MFGEIKEHHTAEGSDSCDLSEISRHAKEQVEREKKNGIKIEENDTVQTGRSNGPKLESFPTKSTKKRSYTMLSRAIEK